MLLRFSNKFENTEHVAVIGDPERRLPIRHRLGHQLFETGRPVQHGVLGVDMKVGERIPHGGRSLATSDGRRIRPRLTRV